VIGKITDKQS